MRRVSGRGGGRPRNGRSTAPGASICARRDRWGTSAPRCTPPRSSRRPWPGCSPRSRRSWGRPRSTSSTWARGAGSCSRGSSPWPGTPMTSRSGRTPWSARRGPRGWTPGSSGATGCPRGCGGWSSRTSGSTTCRWTWPRRTPRAPSGTWRSARTARNGSAGPSQDRTRSGWPAGGRCGSRARGPRSAGPATRPGPRRSGRWRRAGRWPWTTRTYGSPGRPSAP